MDFLLFVFIIRKRYAPYEQTINKDASEVLSRKCRSSYILTRGKGVAESVFF
ncbi:hypothetical protein LEP1GSC052_0494 [Leptospira kmetyi serovar Malaysia str. Bejo-Iso9]|nr:hypothetical protein LEP1GSC052_0494 [Leptospira kmetyi serovar Malaysia str. Bejo-Iso9]